MNRIVTAEEHIQDRPRHAFFGGRDFLNESIGYNTNSTLEWVRCHCMCMSCTLYPETPGQGVMAGGISIPLPKLQGCALVVTTFIWAPPPQTARVCSLVVTTFIWEQFVLGSLRARIIMCFDFELESRDSWKWMFSIFCLMCVLVCKLGAWKWNRRIHIYCAHGFFLYIVHVVEHLWDFLFCQTCICVCVCVAQGCSSNSFCHHRPVSSQMTKPTIKRRISWQSLITYSWLAWVTTKLTCLRVSVTFQHPGPYAESHVLNCVGCFCFCFCFL